MLGKPQILWNLSLKRKGFIVITVERNKWTFSTKPKKKSQNPKTQSEFFFVRYKEG